MIWDVIHVFSTKLWFSDFCMLLCISQRATLECYAVRWIKSTALIHHLLKSERRVYAVTLALKLNALQRQRPCETARDVLCTIGFYFTAFSMWSCGSPAVTAPLWSSLASANKHIQLKAASRRPESTAEMPVASGFTDPA